MRDEKQETRGRLARDKRHESRSKRWQMKVKRTIKKNYSQAYFWTEEWQKGERKADEDIKAGRVKRFETAEEAVRYLKGKG